MQSEREGALAQTVGWEKEDMWDPIACIQFYTLPLNSQFNTDESDGPITSTQLM